jgi:hypothetical protein
LLHLSVADYTWPGYLSVINGFTNNIVADFMRDRAKKPSKTLQLRSIIGTPTGNCDVLIEPAIDADGIDLTSIVEIQLGTVACASVCARLNFC